MASNKRPAQDAAEEENTAAKLSSAAMAVKQGASELVGGSGLAQVTEALAEGAPPDVKQEQAEPQPALATTEGAAAAQAPGDATAESGAASESAATPAAVKTEEPAAAEGAGEAAGAGPAGEAAAEGDAATAGKQEAPEAGVEGKRVTDAPQTIKYRTFKDGKECHNYFLHLLRELRKDQNLNDYERDMVLALLQQGHDDVASKIGPGIANVQVREMQFQDHASACFVLLRTDGTSDNFSVRKCIARLFPSYTVPQGGRPQMSRGRGGGGGGRRGGQGFRGGRHRGRGGRRGGRGRG